jgi:colicin import membrane protein
MQRKKHRKRQRLREKSTQREREEYICNVLIKKHSEREREKTEREK